LRADLGKEKASEGLRAFLPSQLSFKERKESNILGEKRKNDFS